MACVDARPLQADLARLFLALPVLAIIDWLPVYAPGPSVPWPTGWPVTRQICPCRRAGQTRVAARGSGEILRDCLPTLRAGFLCTRAVEPIGSKPAAGSGSGRERADLDGHGWTPAADALLAKRRSQLPRCQSVLPPLRQALNPAEKSLQGVRIGVARDSAFAFYLPGQIWICWPELGADLVFFSPLADRNCPEVDSRYLCRLVSGTALGPTGGQPGKCRRLFRQHHRGWQNLSTLNVVACFICVS